VIEKPTSSLDETDKAVWARKRAFPLAGEGYGWVDRKRNRYPCHGLEELAAAIRSDLDSKVDLVWSPQSPYCQIPEELAELEESIHEVKSRWAHEDYLDALHRLKTLGTAVLILGAYITYQVWHVLAGRMNASGLEVNFAEQVKFLFKALTQSTGLGIAAIAFLIFAFIPWYQSRKRILELREHKQNAESVIPLIRFETWLESQKAPVTWALLAILSLVFAVQMFHDKALINFGASIPAAGLVKEAYKNGEFWRLFTAPMLHGGLIHFGMNSLGLLYLGKRLEVFARWPHLAIVFLFSALVGGEATARLMDAPSVGASGGLMGWLGFLLVYESLHSQLVPKSAKRRLVAGLLMTALIGVLGYRFIDNAAHFGGLAAGMVYAAIVFPKSLSVIRPKTTFPDRMLGILSLLIIAGSAFYAIHLLL
jgi:membrane associated rhomboid family serine protease